MRLRNIQGSKEAIQSSVFVIKNPEKHKNNWHKIFANKNPIQIEIGMGKGKFITRLALDNTHINYIGIEKYSSVLYRAIEKIEEQPLGNLCFIRADAAELLEIFGENEIDKIYLNFSDPWPKDKHAKRRLTSKEFFEKYDKILKKEGLVEFKTDNNMLFEFSLEQIALSGWDISWSTRDLHNSPMNFGNVMTEYEERFSLQGSPINKFVAKRQKSE